VAGVVLVSAGEVVLFLKNELEALRYSPDNPALVFGNQRLASGIGAFASAAVGGWLYQSATQWHGSNQYFWVYSAGQAVLAGLLALLITLLIARPKSAWKTTLGPGPQEHAMADEEVEQHRA
jgi:MFS family permease